MCAREIMETLLYGDSNSRSTRIRTASERIILLVLFSTSFLGECVNLPEALKKMDEA